MQGKIAELKELDARISGQWQAYDGNVYENGEDGDIVAECYGDSTGHAQEIAGFIVAMRNALSELLHRYETDTRKLQELANQRTDERDTAIDRAERAEAALDHNERSAFCDWCGAIVATYTGPMSEPKDHEALAAMLNAMREHQRTCEENPLCAEIAALSARAEKAEASLAHEIEQSTARDVADDRHELLKELEQVKAERDVLAGKLLGMGWFPGTEEYNTQIQKLLDLAAQEVAKREEGV